MEEELITLGELSRLLKISNRTLKFWIDKGLLPFSAIKKDGRGNSKRFSKNDIKTIKIFIEERELIREKYRL